MVLLAVATACSSGDAGRAGRAQGEEPPVTVVVDGRVLETARLVDAVSGLCQAGREAASDPRAAKATYDRRAHEGLVATVAALRSSYSLLASRLTEAAEAFEGKAASDPSPSVAEDLARVGAVMREGLAALGVATEPCQG